MPPTGDVVDMGTSAVDGLEVGVKVTA